MTFFEKLISTQASSAVILIRLMVGSVFLVEGIQKFLFPGEVGAGRFTRIGIPYPEIMAPFVGAAETVCGALVLLGLITRLAVVPLIIIMLVAIFATKIPILIGEAFWGFSLRKVPYYGFWGMAHEARTDWSMLLGSTFLFVVGGGSLSLDATLWKRRATR